VSVYSRLAHDVLALSIGVNDVVPQGGLIPTAMVRNDGTNAETFTVVLTIGSYTSSRTVTALAPGSAHQVIFNTWNPITGNYTATLTATLAGDMNTGNNSVSKGIRAMNLSKRVYAYSAFSNSSPAPEGPISFTLGDPGTFSSIANQSPMTPAVGGTWANGTWYGTTVSPNRLITINPSTGERTLIGSQSAAIIGLSYNTANTTMYGIAYDGVSNTQLYSVNMTTGATTYIGDCGARVLVNIAINNAGQAYSLDLGNDVLGTINLATGAFTVVGSVGFDANYYQGMEFDRETGDLFMAANGNGASWLAWVNTTTGATYKVGELEGDAEVTALAIPYVNQKTLSLSSVMLEGLYNGNGTMRQAYDENGPHYPSSTADLITVELHNAAAYGTIDYSATNIPISTIGIATLSIPATYSSSYYVTIKHRNSIETTSALPVSFSGNVINVSFNTPDNVFNGNMVLMEDGHYVIYGGDVNQDGIIDSSDMMPVDNLSATSTAGYLPEDVNGDGLIDSSDMAILDNNSAISVAAGLPM